MMYSRSTVQERRDRGRTARTETPLARHAEFASDSGRTDPVRLLVDQNTTRESDLVPVRHGRMMLSPFTFYRGAAKIMAADLAITASAGIAVQLCGDAHLSNFGAFGSPERRLLFGLNDFDETLPGPFEYDVKRMAASFVIAARNNGHDLDDQQAASAAAVAAYRSAMNEFAEMGVLNIWYAHLSEEDLTAAMLDYERSGPAGDRKDDAGKKHKKHRDGAVRSDERSKEVKAAQKNLRKAHAKNSLQASPKLSEVVDGRHRIVSQPPLVVPSRDLAEQYGMSADQVHDALEHHLSSYLATLPEDRRHLLEQFEIIDFARKVVGVGSVGTRAYIVLLQGRDGDDPLFLQMKEATSSVLEEHLPRSRYDTPGERVVHGQRLMQSVSDIFLGWATGVQSGRYYYWRQLRDMKGSAIVESMSATGLAFYARLCGWALARAHARSGDPIALAAYMGQTDEFDAAVVKFSRRYADQNERDYAAFVDAVRAGRIEAVHDV
jgi:uncharacterized protein (DUF2252 family)